ncbi:MAG: NifB/NifX family molybdenum-iron cluster-binding protein [Deltaproteobacteria bacterium]|nr:NifB/NifX family molybdenum-iron cluster-binding protein [Deltaproteobacteria bacterium]MBW2635345.1 NifB/NifX family molybdenum-iron cluster-binding protein [Deltaproteobacteria bacterium]MBW2678921.1 NifB/NifX family molybdenum-iron cluster-binding protein [Deltaproteobacteria bacterium]
MKIAFPTQEKNGRQSPVHNHFGSAPYFIIVDTDTEKSHIIDNQNLDHTHGNCQPLLALDGTHVDAVVVGGIGGGALRKLLNEGIKTYRAVEGTVLENLALAKVGKLSEFSMDHTCQGHHHGIGECVH